MGVIEDLIKNINTQRHLFISRYGHDEVSYIVSYSDFKKLINHYKTSFSATCVADKFKSDFFIFGRPLSWSPLVQSVIKLIVDNI